MLSASWRAYTVLFFEKLKARKERAKREAIHAVAALIAREAKQTLKVRPGTSRPGAVPHAHTRAGLRVIRYAVDRNRAIIGPIRFPGGKLSEPVPSVHEFGKTVFTLKGAYRLITFPARPYMIVTLKRLDRTGKIPRQFSTSIARII